MKKNIFFVALALLTLASCKKSGSSAPVTTANTITATVNGINYTCPLYFGDEPYQYNNAEDFNKLWYGYDVYASDSLNNAFYIEVEQMGQIPTLKKYGTPGDSTTFGLIEYDSTGYASPGGKWWGSGAEKLNPASVTILSNTNGIVQGTFSGTVYLYNDTTSSDTKVITNGKFNIYAL